MATVPQYPIELVIDAQKTSMAAYFNKKIPFCDHASVFVYIFSVPTAPAYFNITNLDRDVMDYSATFEWYSPPRMDVQSKVDNYSVNITYLDQIRSYILTSPVLNGTFQYYTEYTISITADNCVGSSDVFVTTFQYGEFSTCLLYSQSVLYFCFTFCR